MGSVVEAAWMGLVVPTGIGIDGASCGDIDYCMIRLVARSIHNRQFATQIGPHVPIPTTCTYRRMRWAVTCRFPHLMEEIDVLGVLLR